MTRKYWRGHALTVGWSRVVSATFAMRLTEFRTKNGPRASSRLCAAIATTNSADATFAGIYPGAGLARTSKPATRDKAMMEKAYDPGARVVLQSTLNSRSCLVVLQSMPQEPLCQWMLRASAAFVPEWCYRALLAAAPIWWGPRACPNSLCASGYLE